jgi:cytochrome c oxidase assembly protein subunit 15
LIWRNFTENQATVQFFHRITAYLLVVLSLIAAWRWRAAHLSLFPAFAGLVGLQAVLGVTTLMRGAPLDLSLLHQALGVLVLLGATRLLWTAQTSAGSN